MLACCNDDSDDGDDDDDDDDEMVMKCNGMPTYKEVPKEDENGVGCLQQ